MSTPTNAPSTSAVDSAANRRGGRRDTLVSAASLWPGRTPGTGKGQPAWVFNISQTGLAFRSLKPLEKGEVYFLRLEAGPFRLDSPVKIAWCRRRDDNTLEAGAEFLHD